MSVEEVAMLLQEKYPQLKGTFGWVLEEGVDGIAFQELTDTVLQSFGVKGWGTRQSILSQKALKKTLNELAQINKNERNKSEQSLRRFKEEFLKGLTVTLYIFSYSRLKVGVLVLAHQRSLFTQQETEILCPLQNSQRR